MGVMRYFLEITEDEAVLAGEAGAKVVVGASGNGNNPKFPGRVDDAYMLLYSKSLLDELDGHQYRGGPLNGQME